MFNLLKGQYCAKFDKPSKIYQKEKMDVEECGKIKTQRILSRGSVFQAHRSISFLGPGETSKGSVCYDYHSHLLLEYFLFENI